MDRFPPSQEVPRLSQRFQKLGERMEHAWSAHSDSFQPLIDRMPRDLPDSLPGSDAPIGDHYASRIAHVKRFLERWTADRRFRQRLQTDPDALLEEYGIRVDPEEIRYLWDADFGMKALRTAGWRAPLIVQQYRLWCSEKLLHRERLRLQEGRPLRANHAAWRDRQMERVLGHLGPKQYESIVHAPFSVELSDGCSVGCWFCGVSAEKRKQDWLYTVENAALWREILGVLRDVIGPAVGAGFCYWATDPLDNPDYEKFCLDFAEICGTYPQTTTAQAHKHVERLRELLKVSREHGCTINRFSILSLGILDKVFEAFTPEELLHTELITQNMEATSMQSNSGRARGSSRLNRKAEQLAGLPDGWEEAPGTIACVSGFLINMLKGSVKLVTPVPSCDRWPNGYWIYEEAHFTDAASFRSAIEGMIARHMPALPALEDTIRFRRDLEFSAEERHFTLKAYGLKTTVNPGPGVREIGEMIAKGKRTLSEIVLEAEDALGLPAEEAMILIYHLFDKGLLDEEPPVPGHSLSDKPNEENQPA